MREYPILDIDTDYVIGTGIDIAVLNLYRNYPCCLKATVIVLCRGGKIEGLSNLNKLEIKKNELDEIVAETRQEEERLRDEVKVLEAKIEPRLLQAFKKIRKNSRNGLGIVDVQRDACGGCFNKIPPQRQLDIRMRKKIIVCEYCGRIMIDPDMAAEIEQKEGKTDDNQ